MDALQMALLFDTYGGMLTDKQRECFDMRYNQDLSLGEIAEELGVSRKEFVEALNAEGINIGAGYIPSCVYQYDMFKNRTAYPGGSHHPFGEEYHYCDGDCPVAEEILASCCVIPVKEYYTQQDLNDVITAIRKVCAYYAAKKA